ncbi:MAG: hypothetical protein VB144_14455 [Clostridia bacterium]|nr:hypothetical protein [Clostridia bacterium]
MAKRLTCLAALVLMTVVLAGCMGQPPFNETLERQAVITALNGWVGGVEAYNVDAMAGTGIVAPTFKLTINEGAATYAKPLDQLKAELNADKNSQASFRLPATGYVIRLDIDGAVEGAVDKHEVKDNVNAWTIVSINAQKAEVTGFFEVYETYNGPVVGPYAPYWRSDSGSIKINLVRLPNAWKMESMQLKYGSGNYPIASIGLDGTGSSEPTGFGFGTYTGW